MRHGGPAARRFFTPMSIRLKLIAWISALFMLMGILIYAPLSYIVPRKITTQILRGDIEIAKHISEQAKSYLLLNQNAALSPLLRDNLKRLKDAQYLFLQGADGRILSHTFTGGFPGALVSFNRADKSPYEVRAFSSAGKRVYDIAVPIARGGMGILHLGVSLDSGRKDIADIAKINYYIAVVILIVLGIGISVFLALGLLFSRQIIKLKNFAAAVGEGYFDNKLDIHSHDEIGALADAFNKMAKSLKEKIREIKRLNSIEERKRLAFDLHDGCAQDIAGIIKRIELCEKLFLQNRNQGMEELGALREAAKELLRRTRGVIFDLKSSENLLMDLPGDITEYVNKYRSQSGINVALTISDASKDIPREKSRDIFYIISEALNNIKKHSRAKSAQVSISIDSGHTIVIGVEDDGRGCNVSDAGPDVAACGKLGLTSMRRRAESLGGTFSVSSELNKGTSVLVRIPMSADWMGL